jgi:hypothetical protein
MVGTHINRNITWADQAGPFMTYLARNSFMLQQGRFVADLAYLLNEGAPSTMPFWGAGLKPKPPEGFDYDYVNSDVLLNRMSVDANGKIVLPDGMQYSVLVLPETDRITLPVLRKIRELVQGGATVLGPKPLKSPSLSGYPNADREVQTLADEVWGDLDGVSRTKRAYGKGTVVWGLAPADVLSSLNIPKDVEYSGALDAKVSWIHRRTDNADIFFVANRSDSEQDIEVRFRIAGREAELWHADSGDITPAAFAISDRRTTVPLHLAERESVFVVFRKATASTLRSLPATTSSELTTVAGPWSVSFQPNLGAPPKIEMTQLAAWSANTDDGVKYFSGTATYDKQIQIDKRWLRPGDEVILDLGVVKDMAEVSINGHALPLSWKAPYRLSVTNYLKAGSNELQIKVTNQWTNRIVGDRTVTAEKRVFSTPPPGSGGLGPPQVLSDSGLIGPVRLVSVKASAK